MPDLWGAWLLVMALLAVAIGLSLFLAIYALSEYLQARTKREEAEATLAARRVHEADAPRVRP